ncbi:hypothetical protein CMQ_7866 [Grosmannia clavigera kw1407]|uniref:PH domain-containing protein n=1 Tax=Grosmannia clavigera (strain kw1407 / UAMH 11150) TaxID=655863 RepID=F0XRU5_GROCL|nr:uncharacterized protein CMQ_7866 [Grosmannia clavigera kw1407]EFW99498.1 hypothetical protein CMQ_7866 [Grosmannia clavigera kw1407]
MPVTTEASPPAQKLTRYRTIRGRNVPESRRYVEPEQKRAAGDEVDFCTRPPPTVSTLLPAALKTMNDRTLPPPEALARHPVQQMSPTLSTAIDRPAESALPTLLATTLPPKPAGFATGRTHSVKVANGSSTIDADEAAQRDANTEMLLAEQKRKDLERLQLQLENHQPVASPPRSTARDKLAFLSRRLGQRTIARDDLSTPAVSKTSTGPFKLSKLAGVSFDTPVATPRTQPSEEQSVGHLKDASSAPDSGTARSSSGFLQLDSSNDSSSLVESYSRFGLERRLRRYERIRDIMNTWDRDTDNSLAIVGASNSITADLDGRGSADARKDDSSDSDMAVDADLELSSVRQDKNMPPPGIAFIQMYHSQKLGRWNKRYISLMDDAGQVIASKKSDAIRLASLATSEYGSSNDFQSLCHLSDYDIYRPTEAEMRRHIKPPKRFCFAVKSQQRTAVFVNMDNLVHFFCIDDPMLAREFYNRVFAWRSWYLVNRKLSLAPQDTTTNTRQQHQLTIRAGESPSYSNVKLDLTSRQPPDVGLRVKESDYTADTRRTGNANEFAAGSLLGSAYDSRKNAEPAKQSEVKVQAPDGVQTRMLPFTEGSLLGTDRSLPAAPTAANSALTPTSATAAASRHEPSSCFPSATEHTARNHDQPSRRPAASSRPSSSSSTSQQQALYLSAGKLSGPTHVKSPPASMHRGRQPFVDSEVSMDRQQSLRRATSHTSSFRYEQQQHPRMPAPLIDLTPKFQEAPQWSLEHRGRGVRAPPGITHLVDLATRSTGGGDPTFEPAAAPLRRDGTDSTPPTRSRTDLCGFLFCTRFYDHLP